MNTLPLGIQRVIIMKILNVNFVFRTINGLLSSELMPIKELQKLGHEVTMVTSDVSQHIIDLKNKSDYDKSPVREDKPIEMFGIPAYVLHCSVPRLGWYCPSAPKLAKKIIQDYDVVHINNWYHHLALVFYKTSLKFGKPYVFTAHGTISPVAREKYMRRTKIVVDKLYTKEMIRNAAALHSLGESETKEFLKFGADKQRIFSIDLGIDRRNLEIKQKTKILEKIAVDKIKRPYMLFLGRIAKIKGIELLLQSFAKMNRHDLTLVIAGAGSKSYEQRIKKLTRDIGLQDLVIFVGEVFGEDKAQLLESAKIFVLTSYSDIRPVAVKEALAMGIPALVTKNCDFPEIEEREAGAVVDADIDSIYQGLTKLLSDETKLSKACENARNLAVEKFLIEDKPKKYEQMYLYAINNNPTQLTREKDRKKQDE